jgi:hydrogenase maturation protease
MRGYDALILVDISRQGGEPGTLYVMEPDENSVDPSLDNGEVIDPHGMDPQTVLRFVKGVGGWPGKVVVIACEPMDVEEMGLGLSAPVQSSLDEAVDLVAATALELLSDAAYEEAVEGSRDA